MERGCHETLLWDTSKTDEEIIKLSTKSGPYDAIIDFVNNSITSRRAHRCLNFVSVHVCRLGDARVFCKVFQTFPTTTSQCSS